jgi:hypothetical protein
MRTAQTTAEGARRAWPRRLLLGLVLLAVAVVAVLWPAGGGRLLLAVLGAGTAIRGVLLLRGKAAEVPARAVGAAATVLGTAALAAAALSAVVTGWVLLVAVPVLLAGGALALMGRGGAARRAGQVLFAWTLLVTALLVASGVGQGWTRAAGVVTVVGALGVAALAVPVLLGAVALRAAAGRPLAAPPAGCGGCACGAGGCAAAG